MQPSLSQLCKEHAQLLDEWEALVREMTCLYETKAWMPPSDPQRSAITAAVDQKTARTRDIRKRIEEINESLENAI